MSSDRISAFFTDKIKSKGYHVQTATLSLLRGGILHPCRRAEKFSGITPEKRRMGISSRRGWRRRPGLSGYASGSPTRSSATPETRTSFPRVLAGQGTRLKTPLERLLSVTGDETRRLVLAGPFCRQCGRSLDLERRPAFHHRRRRRGVSHADPAGVRSTDSQNASASDGPPRRTAGTQKEGGFRPERGIQRPDRGGRQAGRSPSRRFRAAEISRGNEVRVSGVAEDLVGEPDAYPESPGRRRHPRRLRSGRRSGGGTGCVP